MLRINVSAADAAVAEKETLTAGRVGLQCGFTFSGDWDGLNKIVVVEGAEVREVLLRDDTITIPAVCLSAAGYRLRISVTGLNESGSIVIPTIWAKVGKIVDAGDAVHAVAEDLDAGIVAQVVNDSQSALEIARSVEERANSGEFKGEKGDKGDQGETGPQGAAFTYSDFTAEQLAALTGPQGPKGDQGEAGPAGPTGATGQQGPKGDTGDTGPQGATGANGYSPTVSVTDITGGHRVTITDANGTHSFDVMDGQGGSASEEVFWATYGTSTNAEIEAAYQAGKVCLMNYDGHTYRLCGRTSATNHTFACADQNEILIINCHSYGWLTGVYTIPQKTSDLTNDSGFVNASGAAAAAPVQSVNGQTGDVTVTIPSAASTAPADLGASAAVGNGTTWARSNHVHKRPTAAEIGAIAAPSSPASGQFLVYNGSAWVAQTVPSASGVNF